MFGMSSPLASEKPLEPSGCMTYDVGGTIEPSLVGAVVRFGEARKYVGFGIFVDVSAKPPCRSLHWSPTFFMMLTPSTVSMWLRVSALYSTVEHAAVFPSAPQLTHGWVGIDAGGAGHDRVLGVHGRRGEQRRAGRQAVDREALLVEVRDRVGFLGRRATGDAVQRVARALSSLSSPGIPGTFTKRCWVTQVPLRTGSKLKLVALSSKS